MNKLYYMSKRFQLLSLIIITLVFLTPLDLFGQKGNGNGNGNGNKEINIIASCVEYIGDGQLKVHFGYENPSNKTIVIDEDGSVVIYNHGQAIKAGLYVFEPGVKEKAFSQDFDYMDEVEWSVTLPNGKVKTVTANINYNQCSNDGLPVIPGYNPPVTGKDDSKIGAELTALHEAFDLDPNFSDAPEDIFQIDGSKVLIEVVSNGGQYDAMLTSLSSLFSIETSGQSQNRATGWAEISDLLLYNAIDALQFARPVFPGVGNAYSVPLIGRTNSQGDFAMHSDFARLGYEIDGEGIKIGVLSNSYATQIAAAAQDVENGDLPGPENIFDQYTLPVHVLKDYTKGVLSDEGRAMLQIIHDIAPGAELAFRTGFLGEQDMAEGIRELAAAGCDIIVDDLSYITEPFFTDGIISKAIDEVVTNNKVTFFSSAGNFGKYSYMGDFSPSESPSTIIGDAHDFSDGNGDIFQGVTLDKGSYTLVLQWDDGSDASMNTTETDLDIFLSDDVGFSKLGFNRKNVGAFPIEVVPFSIDEESVDVNIVIARASGNRDVRFKYILFRGGPQFHMNEYGGDGSSTIVGHPNAKGAITVGAVRFDKNPVYSSPSDYPLPVIMSFSSVGGTPVIGEAQPRSKPDITAPNGVNTTVDLGNGDWVTDPPEYEIDIDPDTQYPNFFGTSAASPHAAGVAALLLQAGLKYQSDVPLTPAEIRSILTSTTLESEMELEPDLVSGAGFIQAHKAIMTFANPKPSVESLILETEGVGLTEGLVRFTVNGDFFTDDTQVKFRGETLSDENVDVINDSTIVVEHPEFLGNADVEAFTIPISNSLEDGGSSGPVGFDEPVKRNIFINADSYERKFGEVIPDYDVTILVEVEEGAPVLLQQAVTDGIIPQNEADGISDLVVLTFNTGASDVGEYRISPSLDPEFDPDDPQDDLETAISAKYNFGFSEGTMTIDKLPLTITPVDVDMTYGQMLPGDQFSFTYEIDGTGLDIQDLGLTRAQVEAEHLASLTNNVALVRGVALVNGIPMIRGTALVNGVTMIRGTALVNGVEVMVEGEGDERTVYVAGEAVESGSPLLRGVALVNDLPFVNMTQIVRGTALVNGSEVNFDGGYMSLDDNPVENGIPVLRGVALVNGLNTRGVALVNNHTVEVDLSGVTTIDGNGLPDEAISGLSLVNGIPVLRGTALVNSLHISRGIALVNDMGVEITNGVPTGRGTALVNGGGSLRGIALVNGIPLIRGTALVNNLEVIVDEGEVTTVTDVVQNAEVQTLGLISRGVALVNDVALVNGSNLISRGTALVNGIALTDDNGSGDDLVDLANVNFLASTSAIAAVENGLKNVRGTALVNGMEGVEATALKNAAYGVLENGSIVYESSISRGVALVNGLAYVRGTALVNTDEGEVPLVNTHALVNGSTIDENSNNGSILIFDATDIGPQAADAEFKPMSFITGTTAGKHWIVPGTFLSDNYEITYGLGTLCINPAPMTVTVTADNKVYDGTSEAEVSFSDVQTPDIDLDITYSSALFEDKHKGDNKLVTVNGLAVQGLGVENYSVETMVMPKANITPRSLDVLAVTDSKTYDGTVDSKLSPTYDASKVFDVITTEPVQVFDTKHAESGKTLIASGLEINDGNGGDNYTVSYVDVTNGNIDPLGITVTAVTDSRTYDGTADSELSPTYDASKVVDVITTEPVQVFDTKHAESGKTLIASGLEINDGNGGDNYTVSYVDVTNGNIDPLGITVTAVTDSRTYDGTADSELSPTYDASKVVDVITTEPLQVFDTKHAESGKTLIASGLEINDGNGGDNYTVSYVDVTNGNIDPLGITVTAVTDSRTYDGTVDSELSPTYDASKVVDVITTEPVQVFGTKHAESGKTLIASGLEINDGNSGNNYIVSYVNDFTGRIFQKEVYVTPLEDEFAIAMKDPLPDPAFYYDGWIVGDEENYGYTALRDSDGEAYDITSKKSYGHYILTPEPSNANYAFIIETGLLYVRKHSDVGHDDDEHDHHSKSAAVSGAAVEVEELEADYLNAYPNPVIDKVHITMKDIQNYKLIQLYDLSGKSHPITSIDKRTDNLEIDMAELSSGHYIIRIIMEDKARVVQIIKN